MWTVEQARQALAGVIGGPVSPFHDVRLELELGALETNTAAMASHPFAALLIGAGIGEFFSLTPQEIVASVQAAVRCSPEMPMIGTVAYGSEMGAQLARRQEEIGASALLVMPPYYTNAPFEGLLQYYQAIGRATALPLILYSRDWAVFTPDQAAQLAEAVPTLAAWKDGQADMRRYQRIMGLVGNRLAWLGGAGDDAVPGYYAIGVQAYTSSLSNVVPRLAIELGAAGARRDFARLNELVRRFVHPVFALRERRKGYEVAVVKCAMEMAGKKAGPVRPPLAGLTAGEMTKLRDILDLLREWM